MDDSHSSSHTGTPTDFPPALPFPVRHDAALLRIAHAAWLDCREQWLQLLGHGPSLDQLLGQVNAGEQAAALKAGWGAYLKARAKHSPRSRREQASVVLGKHLQAAVQWAYASGQADANALKPALRLLEGGEALAAAGGTVETLALVLAAGGSLELPGALVLSAGPGTQVLLYVPSHTVAVQVFGSLGDLEAELRTRQEVLWPQAPLAEDGPAAFTYTASDKPLHAALNQLMRSFHRETRQALRQDFAAVPQAGATRDYPATEALVRRLTTEPFFAMPPLLPPWQESAEADPVLYFGGLQAGTALETRWAQTALQRTAIERYLQGRDDDDQRDQRLNTLRQHYDALHQARAAADAAAHELLARDDLQGLLALRIDTEAVYKRLYAARLAGLRAELAIQALLLPIAADELALLRQYLAAPASGSSGLAVSVLTLVPEQESAEHPREELQGPLLIECPAAASRAASLWLYWPGIQGGLQRFDSRAALQTAVFGLAPEHSWMAIEYTTVAADALDYALQAQLHACEQAATAALEQRATAASQAAELQRLQAQALNDWGVPQLQARDLAMAEAIEQQQGERIAAVIPSELRGQSDAQRQRFQALARDYQRASTRALSLLARALPERERYAEQAVQGLLQERFGDKAQCRVVLDLPESVRVERQASGDPAYGSTVEKDVKVPSTKRVQVPLRHLALANIDGATLDRLQFMRVKVQGGTAAERAVRQATIDIAWLQRYVKDLDLASAYEQRLRSAFVGSADEPEFVKAHRRECLVKPFRLILKLQAQRFAQQNAADAEAARLVEIAIDANRPQRWQADGQAIVLRAATFTAGGSDTAGQGTTLSGVNFIEQQGSGLTVLVLFDSPDHQWLRRYPSLQEARDGLFDLCLDDDFARYLAGRALVGDPAAHRSRLATAHARHFSAMIGAGVGWPPTTSLAEHLLDAHMGRLIQAHRDSSRSNDTLYLEQVALGSAMVLVYIKMAMGVLPFVGTAVALHDAWQSANSAVDAFLRNGTGEGLLELRNVLLSLMEAAMDLLPGGAAVTPGAARGLVRQRQLRRLGSGLTALQPGFGNRCAAQAFEGYQYERDIRLSPLERGTHGLYRNVYRHADGNFMVREGRVYAIELSGSPRSWRLSGSAGRTYKQPIALDETGQWQSHGTLYGHLGNGGLAGGGGVLGHLADGVDPYWPAAIRGYLPRWWADRLFRQQVQLLRRGQRATDRLDVQLGQTRELQLRSSASAVDDVKVAFARDIELAIPAYAEQQALLAVVRGRKAVIVRFNMSRAAMVIVERSLRLANIAKQVAISLLDEIGSVTVTLVDTALEPALFLERLKTRSLLRERVVLHLDQIELATNRSRQWYDKVTVADHKAKLSDDYAELHKNYNPALYAAIRSANYAELVARYRPGMDLQDWLLFGIRMLEPRNRLDRALFAHEHLLEVRPSAAQRTRVLEQCIDAYHGFLQQLRIWEAGDHEFIDPVYFGRLNASLQTNITDARSWIAKVPEQRPVSKPGAPGKRLFETVDKRLLVGIEVPQRGAVAAQFKLTGINGVEEVYVQGDAGKWQLQAPALPTRPVPSVSLKQLKRQATGRLARLPAYRAKVQGYGQQGMLAKDQEHMLASEARELVRLARLIGAQEADAALIKRLDDSAAQLHAAGRRLRIASSTGHSQPTEGDLKYLLAEQQVTLAKVGGIVELNRRPDGRRDFMQEYEIRRSEPDEPLWYAHFHYDQANPPGFDGYTAAHIKTAAERYVGRQWQAAGAPEPWRGAIGRELASRFAALD